MQLLWRQFTAGAKKRVDRDRLAKLTSELTAIELWDSDYYRAKRHDDIDEASYRHRQERREEILSEILLISGADPRVFRLGFL